MKITRAEQIERVNEGIADKENNSDDDSESNEELLDEPDVSVQERQEIPMPEITPGSEYLVAFLHSAGTASATGMGLTGLSWQEIEAWVRCNDMESIVTPRDLRTIFMLSRAYANEMAAASLKGAQPPFKTQVVMQEETREIVSQKAEDVFAQMMFAQSQRGTTQT